MGRWLGPGRVLGADRVVAELEGLVQGLDGVGDAVGGDDAGDLDRRGGDHLDVDPFVAEDLEDLGGDAGVRAHAGADDRDLADLLVGADLERDVAERGDRVVRGRQVGAVDGEGEVGQLVAADRLVLDDHVDVDVGLGERGEDAAGDAGLVADAGQRHAGLLVGVGHGGYERLLHGLVLGDDEGTGAVLEAAAAVDADAVVAGVLDRAQLQHLGPGGRHLEHLLEGDDRQLAGVGDDPRVGAEDAGDVGVDLADAGVERGGEGDGGGVGAAAAERGDVAALGRDPLEAGDEDDPVLLERVAGCGRRGRR